MQSGEHVFQVDVWITTVKQRRLGRRDFLCDSQTGNIGWDPNDPKNAGKAEAELHERDKDQYKKMKAGQDKDHRWMYSGICYVDHIFGN